jgi:hypothetical protein
MTRKKKRMTKYATVRTEKCVEKHTAT